jgi:hypothetical protein
VSHETTVQPDFPRSFLHAENVIEARTFARFFIPLIRLVAPFAEELAAPAPHRGPRHA